MSTQEDQTIYTFQIASNEDGASFSNVLLGVDGDPYLYSASNLDKALNWTVGTNYGYNFAYTGSVQDWEDGWMGAATFGGIEKRVVVGSKKSANTTHLAEILKDITKTIHIENDTELNNYENLIQSSENIGITAGASTPQNIIDKVVNQIKKGK